MFIVANEFPCIRSLTLDCIFSHRLNSNQLPVAPVIQIQAPVQTMNTIFLGQLIIKSRLRIVLYLISQLLFLILTSSFSSTHWFFSVTWRHVPNNSNSFNPTKLLFDWAIIWFGTNEKWRALEVGIKAASLKWGTIEFFWQNCHALIDLHSIGRWLLYLYRNH